MPYVLERSVVVGVPPEQVFDYLCDLPAHREWGDMAEMELLDDGPIHVGTRWLSKGSTSGVNMSDQCEIVALDRPYRFAFRSHSQSQMGSGSIRIAYNMEPVPEGTRVIIRRQVEREGATGLTKLMLAIPGFETRILPIMDRFMTHEAIDRGLANLRQRLEERAAG